MGRGSTRAIPWRVGTGVGTTIGLDISDTYSSLCVLDADGEVVEEGRVRTTTPALTRRFANGECRVIIEVGTHSPWVSRLLTALGHEVVVANPRRVRLIAESDHKHDRADAEQLARLGRLDPQLLSPIQHRGVRAQEDLALIRSRDSLVAARTALINHVRGVVKAYGDRLPACSATSFHYKAGATIPDGLKPALMPHIDLIAHLTSEIAKAYRAIEARIGDTYVEARALQQVPGVGPLTALTFVLTLENPARFRRSRQVGAYLGLTPRQRESGARAPQLRISKAGDAMLRRLLVACSQYILGPFGPDTDLRRWGMRHGADTKGKARKRAVVGVARRLAVLLHRLWSTGEVYEAIRGVSSASSVAAATG
jgi:transposase